MPRPRSKKAKPAPALSIGKAAKALGVSAGSIRNWLKSEKELASQAVKEGGMVKLGPAAMEILARIRDRRMASASPSLLKAWAGRKRASAAARKAKTKGGKSPATRGKAAAKPARSVPARVTRGAKGVRPPAATGDEGGMSGDQVAKALRTNKVRLYKLLKEHGIRKGKGARSFTPDVVERLRNLVASSGKVAVARVTRVVPAPVKAIAARDDLSQAMATIQGAVDATVRMAAEFRETLQAMFQQHVALVERAIKPIRIRLEGHE